MKQLLFLLLTSTAFAQVINGIALQRVPPANFVQAVPGATISVCQASDTAIPCTQYVSTFTDINLTKACVGLAGPISGTGCSNPGAADANGNYSIFVATGNYTICVQHTQVFCSVNTVGSTSGTGAAAPVTLLASPLTMNFGSVQNGSPSPVQNILLTNSSSTAAIQINAPTFNNGVEFSSSSPNACNGILSPSATCSLSVLCTPNALGAQSGAITINSVGAVNPAVQIPLLCTGIAAATFPLTVSGTDTGSGSITSNDGQINCTLAPPALPAGACGPIGYPSGTPVTLTATATIGSTFQSFNGGTCSVSPCNLTIVSPGFTITADFSTIPSPKVIVPSASIAPRSINFGSIQTGTTSPVQNITISNTSLTSLTINSVVFSGNMDFSSSNASVCNGTLAANAACVVPVMFTPTSAIAETGTITVNTNAPINTDVPLTVALTGTGVAGATFVLSVSASGSGTIQSGESPPLINCFFAPPAGPSGTCSNSYASGATPVLTATPANNGSTFGGFSGGGCTVSPCTVTVTANTTVTATFTPPVTSFTLNVTGVGQGTVTVTSDALDSITGLALGCLSTAGVLTPVGGSAGCSGSFPQGTVVTLTETPGGSSTLVGWTGANCPGTPTTCAVTMTANQTVTVNATTSVVSLALTQTCAPGTQGTNKITCLMSTAIPAGDTLIVFGLWNDTTTTVSSVADTSGNTWTQACTVTPANNSTEVVYYAKNVPAANAGADTITMNLSASPSGRRIHVLDYAGLTTTPLDQCHGATGSGTAVNSGNITTTVANDLLVASTVVFNSISAVSTGWTQQINDGHGNDAEDLRNQAIGTYANAPTQNASGAWIDIITAWFIQGLTTSTNSVTLLCGGNGNGTVALPGGTLTCTGGNPSGTSSAAVASGSSVTLTASALAGSVFVNWQGSTSCSTSATCILPNLTTNATLTATFNTTSTQNFYIAPSGSDSNPCTASASPCKTFAKVVPLLQPGAVLNLANGTYSIANGNGLFAADCSTTAHNGTATAHVTIQATNERQAFISGNGSAEVFLVNHCSYWDIIGIHAESADLNVGNTFTGDVFAILNSSHITLRRNIAARNNRFGNVHPMLLQATSNSLVEENEVYYFHRWGILIYGGSNNNEIRRNYANNRGYDNIGGGYPNGGTTQSLGPYDSNGNIFENNIAEKTTVSATGVQGFNFQSSASNNKALGEIAGTGLVEGIASSPHIGTSQPTGNTVTNSVSILPAIFGFWARNELSDTFDHDSAFGNSSGAAGFKSDNDSSVSFPSYSFSASNSTAQGFSAGTGYLSTNVTGTCDHDNNFGNGTTYSGCTATNANASNPAFGACFLWVPDASPLRNAGSTGDIGANVEYEYINGALTTIPLWSAASGSFRQGATVTGLNDTAGASLFDVQNRLNASQNGCSFRASYTGW